MAGVGEQRGSGAAGVLRLTRPSGWKRIRIYGASSHAPHVRRSVDLITVGFLVVALALLAPAARNTQGLEEAVAEAIGRLPGIVDPIWAVAYDLLGVAAVTCYVVALLRGRWRLVLALTATGLIAVAGTFVIDGVAGNGGDLTDLGRRPPVDGPPVQLVVALAMASMAARELSRPFQSSLRRLVLAGILGAVLLPVASPLRVLTAVLLGLATAALVRFAFGSPVSYVSAGDVRDDLADLGTVAEPVAGWDDGVHEAITPAGDRLGVRVIGRDEWDNQVAVVLWRFLWYRHSGSRLMVSPRQRVQHEAFLMLLAAARGAPVLPVVAAGTSVTGDGVLAFRLIGEPLADVDPARADDTLLDRCWAALGALHDAGIAHHGIDGRAVRCLDDGGVVLGAFEEAHQIARPADVHADRAQLLVATALVAGAERAIGAAVRAVGADDAGAAALVSYLQSPALDPRLRAEVDDAELSLEELRTATAAAAGIELPELQKIWRVTWGSLVRLGLLGLVAYLLISQLSDIGWDTIADSIAAADPWLLVVALLLGQTPRVAGAGSLQAASPTPVPLGRVTRLQFATTFINLAVPSTAARVATSIRFFQRAGATPGGALSAGALDSFAGFLAQITLLVSLLLAGFGSLGWTGLPEGATDRVDLAKVLGILALIIGVVVAVVALVRPIRSRVVHVLSQLKESLAMLRSPATVVRLLLFNVLAELLFSTTIWIVLQAFGQDVSIADVIIINEAVALFAGLMPVPGGVGVTEGALTAGFVAVGVPETEAFAAAICYRMCTFYLPPIWGGVAFRSLRNDGYL